MSSPAPVPKTFNINIAETIEKTVENTNNINSSCFKEEEKKEKEKENNFSE